MHEVGYQTGMKPTSDQCQHAIKCLGSKRWFSPLANDSLQTVYQIGHQLVNGIQAGEDFNNIRIWVRVFLIEDGAKKGSQVLHGSAGAAQS